ncbi:DNA ligase D [Stenotrophomonas sp. PS02289]|uniref:DNA ligase D n=1 Tax=Stenotrophomonas sp. PS02289 TaxID=2991422 RepID=UPI00249B960E|nr:DNA ligase D [Stenotrophomonas sp. PS02289]
MSLSEYRRKRSFEKTREPEPGKPTPRGKRAIFVVQLHHASRRHYDFRLQVGDALKSWAVPKGPSYDPKVKRMAVEVEDHPLDYAGFEGDIPKGEYGGGHVAQFDHGVWATEGDAEVQLAKGHLRFELFGDKLKGGWHLVRSGKSARQPQWLLFKDNDAFAGPLEADDLLADVTTAPAADRKRAGAGKTNKKRLATLPPATRRRRTDWAKKASALVGARKAAAPTGPFAPQLAKLGDRVPGGADWIHEIKWDGYRLLATVKDRAVRLWSRNGLEWTDKAPEIRDAVAALGLESAALDGELIAGKGTKQDFNLLQATLSGERQASLAYVLFDLLHLNGADITRAPLLARKALLQDVLDIDVPHLAYSSHGQGNGDRAFETAGAQHFEGIISKRADRAYHAGRSDDWRKTKQLASEEFAVVGYTAPKGSRTGFGSLLLARRDAEHGWRYAGRVGTGFTEARLREISALIGKAGSKTPSVHIPEMDTDLRSATWFKPRFVVEVFHRGIGGQRLLRQPSLKAVREDKQVSDLMDSDRATSTAVPKKSAKKSTSAKKTVKEMPTLSSPTKVLFADEGITKQDVWDYYTAVMDYILPEVVGRPLSVIRCPSGTAKACFFQKHHTAGMDIVDTVRLKEESGSQGDYLVVRDAAGLMELVQFNTLEFHPWGSHAESPDRADRVVFDLDPGPGVPFSEVKKAATDIRSKLKQLKLESFLRVSGGKGLHVVVPLRPGCDWDLTKRFAKGFAEALAESEPDRFLSKAAKSLRNKRIFVDYLRNGRGATAVASYSLRARPGAPVAMPISWTELSKLQRADTFTLKTVPAKLKRRRKDPWEGIDTIKQSLSRWSRAL